MVIKFLKIFNSYYRASLRYLDQILFSISTQFRLRSSKSKDKYLIELATNGYVYFPVDDEILSLSWLYNSQSSEEACDYVSKNEEVTRELKHKLMSSDLFKYCLKLAGSYYNLKPQDSLILNELKIFRLGSLTSFSSSWQPHHDCRLNRLKFYLCIDNLSDPYLSHPFYYLKHSHTRPKFFVRHNDSRYPYKHIINSLDCHHLKYGTMLVFDTNGIHSNYKNSTEPRMTLMFSLDRNLWYTGVRELTKSDECTFINIP